MKDIEYLKKSGVDIQSSLDIFGSADIYNEKLGEFLVGVHTKIKQLIVFMQKQDLMNYTSMVSSLAEDANIYGFKELAKVAQTHYDKSSKGDYYYISGHINDLINECNKVIILIQEYSNEVEEDTIKKVESKSKDSNAYTSNTILVVDDSNIIRNFVQKIFSDSYNVGTAKDGKEAIQILDENKDNDYIKAMLLDLNMPKIDGFGVLEYMRQNDYLDKIPVSIISGDCSKKTIDRAFTYDIVDMLGKPFNNSSVKSVIEKTLMVHSEK